ncbi:MAG: DUF4416 family protein [Candidatus Omnitrophica bacterium]|nr:DUF4416 family protein [Candidatus Omnitrophota bacterium]MDD5610388.1 DUF4416 family protein [Candidatus Omnitrophota bacterium]
MGKIAYPENVKLIIGLITNNPSAYEKVKKILARRFGKIDFESEGFEFGFTEYYEKEMGSGLKKYFLSFGRLIEPCAIAKIKIFTNSIEAKFALHSKRTINIDPGYLSLAKLVLATTKDYNHRIYLSRGIYAEVTLSYTGKTFQSYEWTYPDYKTQNYINTFNKIREIYYQQIK